MSNPGEHPTSELPASQNEDHRNPHDLNSQMISNEAGDHQTMSPNKNASSNIPSRDSTPSPLSHTKDSQSSIHSNTPPPEGSQYNMRPPSVESTPRSENSSQNHQDLLQEEEEDIPIYPSGVISSVVNPQYVDPTSLPASEANVHTTNAGNESLPQDIFEMALQEKDQRYLEKIRNDPKELTLIQAETSRFISEFAKWRTEKPKESLFSYHEKNPKDLYVVKSIYANRPLVFPPPDVDEFLNYLPGSRLKLNTDLSYVMKVYQDAVAEFWRIQNERKANNTIDDPLHELANLEGIKRWFYNFIDTHLRKQTLVADPIPSTSNERGEKRQISYPQQGPQILKKTKTEEAQPLKRGRGRRPKEESENSYITGKDLEFLTVYTYNLAKDNKPVPPFPNTLSASGVLTMLISGKLFMLFKKDTEYPIKFVEFVSGLVDDEDTDWTALFNSQNLPTKAAWNRLIQDKLPIIDEDSRKELSKAIAHAMTIGVRPNDSDKGFYIRKLEFCIHLIIIGTCKVKRVRPPINFSQYSRRFWSIIESEEAFEIFSKSRNWKIPKEWKDGLEEEKIDKDWDKVVEWIRTEGNYNIIHWDKDLSAATGHAVFKSALDKDLSLEKIAKAQAKKIRNGEKPVFPTPTTKSKRTNKNEDGDETSMKKGVKKKNIKPKKGKSKPSFKSQKSKPRKVPVKKRKKVVISEEEEEEEEGEIDEILKEDSNLHTEANVSNPIDQMMKSGSDVGDKNASEKGKNIEMGEKDIEMEVVDKNGNDDGKDEDQNVTINLVQGV